MVVNDVVMVKDENVPRNAWRLARVEEAFSSHDGIVRKIKLAMVTRALDKQGRRTNEVQYLERPVHKLVLIQERIPRRGAKPRQALTEGAVLT